MKKSSKFTERAPMTMKKPDTGQKTIQTMGGPPESASDPDPVKRLQSCEDGLRDVHSTEIYEPDPMTGLLTEQMSMFVEAVAGEFMNPTAAARYAGYTNPTRSGNALKNHPKVIEAVRRRREALQREFAVSKEEVVSLFRDAARVAKLQSDPQTMVNAGRELGRMHGFYEPSKIQINAEHRHTITPDKVAALPDSQLLQYLEDDDVIDINPEDYSDVGNK